MGIVLRQSIKGSIAQYIGILIGYLNLLYVIPYALSPEYNGLFRLILETATFFALFAQAGIPNAIPRFGPHFRQIGAENKLVKFSLWVPLITIVLFAIIYAAFFRNAFNQQMEARSGLFLSYEIWLIPIVVAIVYQNVLENLIANFYRITVSKIIREVFLRLGLTVICCITFYLGLNLYQFMGLMSGVYLIAALAMLGYLLVLFPRHHTTQPVADAKAPWKQVSTFMTLILLSGLGTNLVNKLDIFMVSSQIGLTDNAIYSTAFLITMVMEVPSRSFHQIMAPLTSEAIHSGNNRKVSWAYKKSSTAQTLIALIIFSFLLLNARWVLGSMPDAEIYSQGYVLIVFLGLAKLFDAYTGINGLILANSKYYYVGIYFTIALAAVAILLNTLFIPLYGLNGVAYATALTIFLYNLIMSWFVWYRFKINPFSRSALHLIWIAVVSAIFLACQHLMGLGKFLPSALLSLGYLLALVYLLRRFPILKEIRTIIKRLKPAL